MKFKNLNLATKIGLGSGIPLALLVLLAVVSVTSSQSMQKSTEKVIFTYEAIQKAKAIEAAAVDMETGMRGYLLAGKEDFLAPYNAGKESFASTTEELKVKLNDTPEQVQLLEEIQANIDDWQTNVTEHAIALRREIGDAPTMNDMADLVGQAKGKTYFDKFRSQVALFIGREQQLMQDRVEANDAAMVVHTYEVMSGANEILAAAVDMETGMRGYLLAGKEDFLEPYNQGKDRFAQLHASLVEMVDDNPDQVTLLNDMQSTISQWVANVTEPTINLRREIGDAKNMDDMADLVAQAAGKTYFDKFRGQIETFVGREAEFMKARQEAANQKAAFARMAVIGGTCIALFIGSVLAWIIARSITKPVMNLVSTFKQIASGDLTSENINTTSKDEIGQLSNAADTMKDSLFKLVSEVKSTAGEVASSATELFATSEQLSAGMDMQSDKTIQVASAVEEMSMTVLEVARKSSEATDTAGAAGDQANEGGEIVRETVEAINTIADVVNESASAISELGKRSEEIGEVISVINDIADQTNLLALNAAIEAARAGEHGRGFAVVADEVRKLAERTTIATQQVSISINGIQEETSNAVKRMEVGTESVNVGVQLAGRSGESLNEIVNGADEVSSMISSIAAASEQQSTASKIIAENVEEISEITRESSIASKETSAAASQLSEKSEALGQLVGQFKIA
ncbi:MAG: CHASE3 domain-containing protein [Phycisphaerales bacterium]